MYLLLIGLIVLAALLMCFVVLIQNSKGGGLASSFASSNQIIDVYKRQMRNFQRQLVADGLKLKAYPFTKILDVDHASDIVKAENFLTGKDE